MRSITTLLLLISFLVLQYARQVSSWECRLANYFKAANQQCDCEKLIKQVAGKSEPSPVPAAHNHFHLDESFYPSHRIPAERIYDREVPVWCLARHIFISRMVTDRLDRPPQIS